MMKTFCLFLTVLLAGCSSKPPAAPVIKDNTELFKYVDGIELVVSDAASALTAIAENTDKKSVSWILLDAQISRLSGIKEPSVVKVGEYRTTITKNDAVAAAKDKDLAIKVDNETSLAWAKVEAMNSELAKAKLAKANSDAIAERAIKDNTISKVTSLGLGMILIGVIAIAFTTKKFSGMVFSVSGLLCISSAWFLDSQIWQYILAGLAVFLFVNVAYGIYKYAKKTKENSEKE
jgi:hypothetical protein